MTDDTIYIALTRQQIESLLRSQDREAENWGDLDKALTLALVRAPTAEQVAEGYWNDNPRYAEGRARHWIEEYCSPIDLEDEAGEATAWWVPDAT